MLLLLAIIFALVLMYFLFNESSLAVEGSVHKKNMQKRVGSVFLYNDMSELQDDEPLPMNTVTGPGGGSFLKKSV
jgi:hypothetical protein